MPAIASTSTSRRAAASLRIALLRGVGVSGRGTAVRGAALASYLWFEAPYTRELVALGEADTLARRDEVAKFFGWERRVQPRSPGQDSGFYTAELESGNGPMP